MVPAFTNIGTIAAGANGVEILPHDEVFNPGIVFAVGTLHFHPVRQTGADRRVVFQVRFFAKIAIRRWKIED